MKADFKQAISFKKFPNKQVLKYCNRSAREMSAPELSLISVSSSDGIKKIYTIQPPGDNDK